MSDARQAAGQMADEVGDQIRALAWNIIEVQVGDDPRFGPAEKDGAIAGIEAGYLATILVLQERGIVPGRA